MVEKIDFFDTIEPSINVNRRAGSPIFYVSGNRGFFIYCEKEALK